MRRSTLRFAVLSLALTGCALFGGKNAETKQWEKDAKAQAKAATPEAERDMAELFEQQNERITEMRGQVEKSTNDLSDLLLGKAPMGGLPASTFEAEATLLTKHLSFPHMLPFEERELNKFFAPMSKSDEAKLGKLYKNRPLADKVIASLRWLTSAGYLILLEQNRAVTLNWSAELMVLALGSQAIAFEKRTETKVGNDTLDALAVSLANRDQSRTLLVTHTGSLAVFEGIAQGGDPKAMTGLSNAMKAQAAASPESSREAARAFLDGISGEALDVAASLEAGMRGAVGDKSYENAYQDSLVMTLQQIEKAQNEPSVYDQIDQQARQAKQKEVAELARTAKDRLVARAKEIGLEQAKGFIGGLPGGKQLLAGLRAIKELRNGNPRGAIEAALEAAPPGPIGEGLKTASKIAFAVHDIAKRRKGA